MLYEVITLTIGILFGIYSSVFVASPLLMWLRVSRAQFVRERKSRRDENEGAVV